MHYRSISVRSDLHRCSTSSLGRHGIPHSQTADEQHSTNHLRIPAVQLWWEQVAFRIQNDQTWRPSAYVYIFLILMHGACVTWWHCGMIICEDTYSSHTKMFCITCNMLLLESQKLSFYPQVNGQFSLSSKANYQHWIAKHLWKHCHSK